MTLKAIETFYNGHLFRSRTEARWAVFFDTLGVAYRYEMEGYELFGIRYLPDFWLPGQQCWFEVKGIEPDESEREKAFRLAHASGRPVFIFWGGCEPPDGQWPHRDDASEVYDGRGWDNGQMWCDCGHCGAVGITFEGRAARLPCGCIRRIEGPSWADRHHRYDAPRLTAAFTAARMARFDGRPPGGSPST